MTQEKTVNIFNEEARYLRTHLRVNAIPYDTANVLKNPNGGQPLIKWVNPMEGQTLGLIHRAQTDAEFENLIKENKFRHGIAIQFGKAFPKESCEDVFVYGIDIDGPKAMKAFLTREDGSQISLEYFVKDHMITQHYDNLCKAHLIGFSTKQLPHMSAGGIEVFTKSKHLMNVAPSMHEGGYRIVRRGATIPTVNTSRCHVETFRERLQKIGL